MAGFGLGDSRRCHNVGEARSRAPEETWHLPKQIGSELFQEAQVVVEEQADVVNAVLQHGDAFDPQPEG